MYDLIIEGTPENNDDPKPIIKGSKNLGRLEFHNTLYRGKHSDENLNRVINWLEEYSNDKNLPILHLHSYFIPFPIYEDELQYKEYYTYSESYFSFNEITKRYLAAFRKLKVFDTYYPGRPWHGALPTFYGKMSSNIIQIKRDSYGSYGLDYFSFLYLWLDYYLTFIKPDKVRLEFWITYMDTYNHRLFHDFVKVLEAFKIKFSSLVNVYWYYSEGDIDSREYGEHILNDINLDIEIIQLTKEQYEKMSK